MEKSYFIKCTDHDIPMNCIYPDDNKGQYPCMLLLHGFMSSKNGDGYLLKRIGEALCQVGIASCRIDFASMGENLYPRTKYEMKTMIQEVYTSFQFLKELDFVDENHIGILGHSLGGRCAFLCSPLPSSILVSLNGDIGVNSSIFVNQKKDYVIYQTSDGRSELLYKQFYDELKDYECMDVYRYKNPIMICVGTKDPTLNPNISYDFIHKGMKNVDSILIEGANHTFHAKTNNPTYVNQLIEKLIPWIQKNI